MSERQGHAPIKMRRVHDDKHARKVGDFYWKVDHGGARWLRIRLPYPSPRGHRVSGFRTGGDESWHWDGDSDRPTIRGLLAPPGWRGYVRNGFLVSA